MPSNIFPRVLVKGGESPLWDKFSAISCKFNGPFAVSDLSEMAQQLSPFGPVLI